MFFFVGGTVLDPFCGSGTTMVAAIKTRRNSIGIELDTEYCRMAASRLMNENGSLFSQADLQIQLHASAPAAGPPASAAILHEAPTAYRIAKQRTKAPRAKKRSSNGG